MRSSRPPLPFGSIAPFRLKRLPCDLQLRDAKDAEIFNAARQNNAVVMTKDSDFLLLLERLGPPPQVIWVTCGNTSNTRLKEILTALFPKAIELLEAGEGLVEISAS